MAEIRIAVEGCCGHRRRHILYSVDGGPLFSKQPCHRNLQAEVETLGVFEDADVSLCAVLAYTDTLPWWQGDTGIVKSSSGPAGVYMPCASRRFYIRVWREEELYTYTASVVDRNGE